MKVSEHRIKILGEEKIFLLKEDKHLGDFLAPDGCHGGGCGICKIKIISGEVRISAMSKKYVSDKDRENGFALACKVFPLSDLVIENIENNK
jgi:ferredoxin